MQVQFVKLGVIYLVVTGKGSEAWFPEILKTWSLPSRDAANGIDSLVACRRRTHEELYVGDTCVTPEQFAEVFGNRLQPPALQAAG